MCNGECTVVPVSIHYIPNTNYNKNTHTHTIDSQDHKEETERAFHIWGGWLGKTM